MLQKIKEGEIVKEIQNVCSQPDYTNNNEEEKKNQNIHVDRKIRKGG